MCYLRRKFTEQVAHLTVSDKIHIADTGVCYLQGLNNISAEDVKLFLLRHRYKSFVFLSDYGYFCLAAPSKPSSHD